MLLIGHNPKELNSMNRSFEIASIELDFATNGSNGLKKLSEESYDLIALDSTSRSDEDESLDRFIEAIERLDPNIPMIILGFDDDVSAEGLGLKGAKLITSGQDQLVDLFVAEIKDHALRRLGKRLKTLKERATSKNSDFSSESQDNSSSTPVGSELATILEELSEIAVEMREQNKDLVSTIQKKNSSVDGRTLASENDLKDALDLCERRYRSFVENFNGIAFQIVIGPPYASAFVHGAVEEITGYPKEKYLKSDDLSWLVHPDDLPGLRDQIAKSRSISNYSAEREYRIIRKDGEIRWVHEMVQNICDESGTPIEVEGTIYDVTDRKMAEESLKESEEMLDLAIEGAGLGIWNWDMTSDEIIHNIRYSKITGLPPERLKSDMEDWKRPIHPDDLISVERKLKAIIKGEVTHFEMDYRLRSGSSWRWIHDKGKVVSWDEAGNPVKMAGIMQDITDRKNTEEELRHTHYQMMKIIDLLPDATFVIDKDRKVIAWNRAIEKMTGVSKEEIVGKGEYTYAVPAYGLERPSLADFVFTGDEDIEQYYDYVERKDDTIFAEVFISSLCGGKGAYVWIKASPILDEEGNVTGTIQSIRDVTDRKKAEEKLRLAHHQLQDIIDFLPDATFVVDRERRVIAWNRAIERMTGVSKESIIGKSDSIYAESVHGSKRPIITDFVFSDGEDVTPYYDYVKKVGDTVFAEVFVPSLYGGKGAYVWIKASPLFDSEGNIAGAIQSTRDITEKKQIEDALKESEERYRVLVELSPEAIGIHFEGKFVYMNSVGIKLHGAKSFDELEGRYVTEFTHPDYHDIVKDRIQKCYEEKIPAPFVEDRTVQLDGTVIDVEVASVPIAYQGKPASLFVIRDITERKRTEDHLKQLADISGKLIEISNPMLFVVDQDKRIIIWNRAAEVVTGYTAKEATVGMEFWERLLPDSQTREETLALFEFVERGGSVLNQKIKIKVKSGEDRMIAWNGLKLEDSTGTTAGVVVTGQDVTEHIKMEEEIRSEREFSRSIIQGTELFIVSLDPEGVIHLFNKGAENMTGYTGKDVLGKNFFDLLIPDAAKDDFRREIESVVKEGTSEQMDGPLLNRFGEEIALQWSWSVARDSSGVVERVIAFGQDMSYNRWLEEQMLLFMDAVESSNDGIAIFDQNGHLLFANPALLDMFDFKLEEVKGRLYADFIQERDEVDKREIDSRGWRGRMTCIKKDKTTFPASVSFAPVSGRDGCFSSIVAVVRDISPTIDYERKMESLNRELESFAYTISHDLRAPLRGIQGFATFLMEDYANQLDETGINYLERIVRSSANMDRLILDLLDYSRVGRIKGLPEQLKMDDLIWEAYEEVGFLIKDRDVQFDLEGEFPTVVGEKSRIKQIFANLLSNSLKYTGEKPKIVVGCIDRGDRYEFWVQDNGKGFDMTYHDRIFEPFYRLDRSREGTGIGLATVKKIVETAGGTIWADSIPGKGSTFRFYLSKKAFQHPNNDL